MKSTSMRKTKSFKLQQVRHTRLRYYQSRKFVQSQKHVTSNGSFATMEETKIYQKSEYSTKSDEMVGEMAFHSDLDGLTEPIWLTSCNVSLPSIISSVNQFAPSSQPCKPFRNAGSASKISVNRHKKVNPIHTSISNLIFSFARCRNEVW